MRLKGGNALGEEAAGVVRQAVSLAARRGHAQVTPLHIASAMLSAPASAPAGVLRAACVRSQSHPMQHNALDLCLDLALSGLAVSSVANHGGDPPPSNAFVAALKRPQSQLRSRGESKVELWKLVVSVLDDPSVDRVMRAAGFSSSQVRASVVALSEKSSKEGQEVVRTSPNHHVPRMIRAGGGQPHLHTVTGGSESQASKTKSGAGRPAIFGGTEPEKTPVARRRPKFTELTATNLKILCDALELRVPWHNNIIPGISSTVLRCRSGVTRRRAGDKMATWLLFLGRDGGGKMAVARELARIVFGSYADFTALTVQGDPDIPARTGKLARKRPRSPENNGNLGARLREAVMKNPHRVILIDGVDHLDRDTEMRIKNTIMGGAMVGECNGEVIALKDAIVVLCASEVLGSRYVVSASSPHVKQRLTTQEGDTTGMENGRSCRRRRPHGWDLNVGAMDGGEDEEEDRLNGDEAMIMNVVDGVFLFN